MNKPHCIVPWVYFFAEANGDVVPCCVNDTFLGNVLENNYKEVWNSRKMNRFRRNMLTPGPLPETCRICIENNLLTSDYNNTYNLRDYYNNFFKDTFDEIQYITNEDGSIKEDKIKFKSFVFKVSNKCNFQCRMCNGSNSSLIEGKVIENPEFYRKFIEENIDDLELIEFIGGESFLMKETYELLEFLIQRNKPHPHLHFNTNMSVLNLGNKSIFDYLSKLDKNKIEIVASIDEIDERSEYIRKNSNWKTIEKNLKLLSEQDLNVNTNIVASCYNVFRLPVIIQRLVDIGHINEKYNYQNFMFNPVIGDCDISLLSKNFKKKIDNQIYDFLLKYNKKYDVDVTHKFKIIFSKLNKEESKDINDLRIEFLKENHKKDIIRGEKLLKTFPELKDITNLLRNGN
jgi:radical SAM protein with 4Fe4S-binding SPASM domain